MTFVTTEYNMDILLRVLPYVLPWLAHTLKYNALCLNIKGLRSLMERMLCDWNELINVQEIEIIKKYADIARFITLLTTLFVYGSIFVFILIQLLPHIFLIITSSKNDTNLRQLPVLIECFLDQQKYYFLLLLILSFAAICCFTTVIATETLIMAYVHHACGLFEIASCRIEQAFLENRIKGITSVTQRNLIICQGIINGFEMYNRAVEFIDMVQKSYKWAYSLLMPLGVLSLSINLFNFSRLVNSKNYIEMIISFIFIIGHFGYMFFCNYLGQQVIDESSNVFHRLYNVKWYVAPLKAQKLLLLVMQRSIRHCTIVMDGLFITSFEGIATLGNTSFSYFALIFSLY
ncbi:odorant receptor 13a-like [Solenopsis invicta]|uniref:odorant receptor 13a-like n=1 Tax=Solenopsis invicta TaxID=13686 RepID=UPI00193E7D4C|nr:odorant receptor 13a-like [Solenopsis invicta]XP_039311460.1 odorant receptor 13a-like [Solenopsis invicta]